MLGAVILAAGEGARLGGRCKATLRLADGRSFVEAVIAGARAAGAEIIVVVAGPPHAAETRAAAGELVELVENPAPARGMLSSLVAGLAALPPATEAALAWPVDHPFVDPRTARLVLGAARRDLAVVPTFGGRGGHPTAFGAALFPALAAAVDAGGGARAVLAAMPERVVRLPVDDAGVLRDVDAPGDLP